MKRAPLPVSASFAAIAVLSACSSANSGPAEVARPASYARPTAGSGGFGFANGSCFAGAAAPSGLAKVGPDTSGPYGTANWCSSIGKGARSPSGRWPAATQAA